MNWTNETVLRFLELFKMNPCIWDPKNTSHKNKTRINDAWIDIQNNMGVPCTVKELKKKRECLMSAYRGYRTKVRKSKTSGAGNVYQPTWFAFRSMDNFLRHIYKCNSSMTTECEYNPHDAEDSNSDQNDTDDTTKAPNSEQGTSSPTPKKFKRKVEVHKVKKQMDQSFIILKTVSQQQCINDNEDECQIFGRLVAKKLSKLSENRRDLLMIRERQCS